MNLESLIPVFGTASTPGKKSVQSIKTICTDILVVGSRKAEIIAAIQAARVRSSAILMENGSQLAGATLLVE
jgi:heterodisulfide reductase subunit A-like polyferredoxin